MITYVGKGIFLYVGLPVAMETSKYLQTSTTD